MRVEYGTVTEEERSAREAEGRPAPNLQRAMANLPGAATHQWRLVRDLAGRVPADIREVAILAVSAEVGNGYCWGQHAPVARRLGYSREQVEGLFNGDHALLDERDELVARYAIAVERRAVDDGLFDEVRQLLGAETAAALTMLTACYCMIGRVQSAFDVPQDDGFGWLGALE